MNVNLETLVAWSAPKRVSTRNGDRNLRKGPATQEFWAAWRSGKEAMKAAGISCSPAKDGANGAWLAMWWQPVTEAPAAEPKVAGLTPEQEARLAALAGKLLPYQVEAVRTLATALAVHGGALDASDTGTGKTFVALAAAAVLERPVFVVCPKAVIPSWKRAAAHFGTTLYGIVNYELARRGEQPCCRIVGEGKAEHFEWLLPKNVIVVADEVHRCKDYKAIQSKMMLAAVTQGYTVAGLSATAADNPMQMKVTGLLVKQFAHEKQFWGWMLKNGVSRGRFGLEFSGSKAVLSRLHHAIFPEHGSRLRIADLGDAFPETQIAAEAYELNGAAAEIQAAYDEMADEIARLEEREACDRGACVLTARLRARQRSEILKAPAIAALVQDQVEEGMSVAVFVNFDDVMDALAAKLGTKCVVRGGQSAEVREANVAAFQADKEPIILCNIKAGGVGISLHGCPTARMRYSIICPSDSAQDMKQAAGRVWRANGAKSIQRIFLAAGTIEEKVYGNAVEKIGRIDALNDGDGSARPEAQEAEAVAQPTLTTTVTVKDSPAAKRAQDAPVPVASAELKAIVLRGVRELAACDQDKARVRNGEGFSKFDVEFGHSLAMRSSLTDRAAWSGAKLCRRYRKQLGESFLAQLDELTKSSTP